MSSPSETLILVAGAGPAGLVLALTLLKNGFPVRLVDKASDHHVGQRGSGLQSRTLEVFHFLGVLPAIQAKAIPLMPRRLYKVPGGVEPIDTRNLYPHADPTPSAPFPNALMLGQDSSEAILRSRLEELGGRVELNTELRTFEQTAGHVVAHLVKTVGGQKIEESVTCRWLVGTDGAKGIVRKELGLSLLGETRIETHIIIGDVEVQGLDEDHWHNWGDPSTISVMLRPTEVKGLFSFALAGHIDYDLVFTDRAELIKAFRAGTDRDDIVFGEVKWISNYRPNIRMVNKFQEGRVFVAGDAAHVHSASGGQGLNSSVQDTFNLGWKLALTAKGVASPTLLSTYNEERLPVIREMLSQTTKILETIMAARVDDPDSQKAAWTRSKKMQQLGVNYRWSSIVVDERVSPSAQFDAYGTEDGDEVHAGDRAPDAPDLVVPFDSMDGGALESAPTSLFSIFSPAYHTVLVFTAGANVDRLSAVVKAFAPYPSDLMRLAVIYPQGTSRPSSVEGADLFLVDRSGHAYKGYSVNKKRHSVVIVRPDAVIGAIVSGVEGVRKYMQCVSAM